MRSLVVLITVIIVLLVYDSLDTFIAIAGSIFGMINVLMLPALCHMKLMATSEREKFWDYCLVGFAIVMMAFLPFTIIYTNARSAE